MNPPVWLYIGIGLAYIGLIVVAWHTEKNRKEREELEAFLPEPE